MEFTVQAGGSKVPPGLYKARFLGVEECPPHPEFGKGVRFKWEIAGPEQKGEIASVVCGVDRPPTPKNRLGRILGGLAGTAVAPGMQIKIEPFVGKDYLLTVEAAPGGNGTRVATVMPSF